MTEIINTAVATETTASLEVGSTAYCQFGNRSDSSGFEEAAKVEILRTKQVIGTGTVYLVRKVGTTMIGAATAVVNRKTGVVSGLYCTAALVVGTHAQTEEQAAEMLRF